MKTTSTPTLSTLTTNAYAAVRLATDSLETNGINRARASVLCLEIWANYDASYTPKKVYDDLQSKGFLPVDAIYKFEAVVFGEARRVVFRGASYDIKKGGVLFPSWLASNARADKIDIAKIKKDNADVININENARDPFYKALAEYSPFKVARVKSGARTADTKKAGEAPKVETKGMTAPAELTTAKDWIAAGKVFMEAKPTMSQRRAVLMQLQTIFNCDIEAAI